MKGKTENGGQMSKNARTSFKLSGAAKIAAITYIIVLKRVIKVINFSCNTAGTQSLSYVGCYFGKMMENTNT